MFNKARWRLVGWNVLVFGILLVILGFAAYGVFASRIYSGVDAELRHQENRVMAVLPQYGYNPYTFFDLNSSFIQGEYRTLVANPVGQVNQSPTECPEPLLVPTTRCRYDSMHPTSDEAITRMVTKIKDTHKLWSPGDPFKAVAIEDLHTDTFRGVPWRSLTFAVVVDGVVEGIIQVSRVANGEVSALQEMRVLLLFGGFFGILLASFGSLFLADRALVPIRQAFARQRQFTADASHELRTPLALIRANAEMLYRHAGPEDGELVGEIIRETDHLNRLVGDLLTLARADAESLKLVSKPVDFRSLVESVHEDLQAIAESRGIGTNVSLNGPVMVQGDETRLRQLLLILLDNALKYTDPGGQVNVSIGKEDNRARLVVSDTGVGIPAGDLPHIFERFYRVDRAREHESGGTGLGLAIARWIVQAHHGNIKVESESGRGARFQVDLPVSAGVSK
jgi:signal transduction histidine kinase